MAHFLQNTLILSWGFTAGFRVGSGFWFPEERTKRVVYGRIRLKEKAIFWLCWNRHRRNISCRRNSKSHRHKSNSRNRSNNHGHCRRGAEAERRIHGGSRTGGGGLFLAENLSCTAGRYVSANGAVCLFGACRASGVNRVKGHALWLVCGHDGQGTFHPSQALAMGLKSSNAKRRVSLSFPARR